MHPNVSGSGHGSQLGMSQSPLQWDIETTAWTQVNKFNLNIVKDNMAVPFTQYGQHPKYESTPTRSLAPPLQFTRVKTASDTVSDDSWKPYYDDLVGSLPPNVRNAFEVDKGKPFDDRNPSLVLLGHLMTVTAKGMAWASASAQTTAPDSPSMEEGSPLAERTIANQSLVPTATATWLDDGSMLQTGASYYLSLIGPNDPHFDTLSGFSQELGKGLQILGSLNSQGAKGLPDYQERWAALAKNSDRTSTYAQNASSGDQLHILGTSSKTLSLVSSANALPNGSPSLFIGLDLAMSGIGSSPGGILGNPLMPFIQGLTKGIIALWMPGSTVGQQKFFENLVTMAFLGAMCTSSVVANNGIGPLPKSDNPDTSVPPLFPFELVVSLVANSGILEQTFGTIAAAAGAQGQSQEEIGNILSTVALGLCVYTAAKGNEKDTHSLVSGLKEPLSQSLDKTNAILNQKTEMDGDLGVGITAYAQQASIALQQDDPDDFIQAIEGMFGKIGVDTDKFQKDLNQINDFALSLWNSILMGWGDQTNTITGIAQSA